MTHPQPSLNKRQMKRRTFLKHLGLATALPTLSPSLRALAADANPKSTLHLLSCNIRVALPEDETAGNGWSARRDVCIDVIRSHKPDVICLQEVLEVQMRDLERAFPDFGSFGFAGPEMDARKEGYQGIAKNPIFYSRNRYDFVSAGTMWLSETPHLPGSSSWDSARPRHANWVRLRDRTSGVEFRVISTHLDHVSQKAKEEQIKLVLAEADTYQPDFPQVLAGDFNSGASSPVIKSVLDAGWTNTQTAAPGPVDNGLTVHSFLGPKYVPKSEAGRKKGPIDFILTRGPVNASKWKIIRDERNGRYPSDHYFLAATLVLG